MKKSYIPPQLQVVTFHIEQGFAVSGSSPAAIDVFGMTFDEDDKGTVSSTFERDHWSW